MNTYVNCDKSLRDIVFEKKNNNNNNTERDYFKRFSRFRTIH